MILTPAESFGQRFSSLDNKTKRSSEQTYIADESFKEDEFCLQLLHPQSQLILTHLALLQVLKNTHTSSYVLNHQHHHQLHSTFILIII